eukprot:6492756-Amphidinium_carterae.2
MLEGEACSRNVPGFTPTQKVPLRSPPRCLLTPMINDMTTWFPGNALVLKGTDLGWFHGFLESSLVQGFPLLVPTTQPARPFVPPPPCVLVARTMCLHELVLSFELVQYASFVSGCWVLTTDFGHHRPLGSSRSIMPLAVESLGVVNVEICHHIKHGRLHQLTRDRDFDAGNKDHLAMLRKSLGEIQNSRNRYDSVLVLDCRVFFNPARVGGRHTGRSLEVIRPLVQHTAFADKFETAMAFAAKAFADPKQMYVVICLCSKGTHRSVAMAECIHAGIAYYFDAEVELLHHCCSSWANYACRAPCCTWTVFPPDHTKYFKELFARMQANGAGHPQAHWVEDQPHGAYPGRGRHVEDHPHGVIPPWAQNTEDLGYDRGHRVDDTHWEDRVAERTAPQRASRSRSPRPVDLRHIWRVPVMHVPIPNHVGFTPGFDPA